MSRLRLLLSALALSTLLAVPDPAFARAGGGQNYSRSSSSSSSSRSSSSSSRSSSSGSRRSGASSGGGAPLPGWVALLVFGGFAAFVLYGRHQARRRREAALTAPDPRVGTWSHERARWEAGGPAPALPAGVDRDPFLARVDAIFLATQAAWSAQDMGPARRHLSDAVWQRFEAALAVNRAQGVHNRTEQVQVLGRRLAGARREGPYDCLTVHIRAAAVDQTFRGGARVGGRPALDGFEELWTFFRRHGAPEAKAARDRCLACGSPLDGGGTAVRCGACGALMNDGAHDWVLAEITQLDAPPDQPVHVTAEARALAPDLSVQRLEDQASLAFWSLARANADGNPRPLARIVRPGLVERAEGTLASRAPRPAAVDIGVGAVQATQVTAAGAELDATVQVHWAGGDATASGGALRPSGTGGPQTAALRFRKKPGPPAGRGLAIAACPSCGGPFEWVGDTRCSWCDAPLTPAETDWILVETSLPWLGIGG